MTVTSEQPEKDYNLHDVVLNFFVGSILPSQSRVMGNWSPCIKTSTHENGQHQHLLSFIHHNWKPIENCRTSRLVKRNCPWFFYGRKWRPCGPQEKLTRFIRCATELKEAGIKFKRVYRIIVTDICFENGTMNMPQLEITGETESIFRNLIVYEQYFAPSDEVKLVSQYIKFMDGLILPKGCGITFSDAIRLRTLLGEGLCSIVPTVQGMLILLSIFLTGSNEHPEIQVNSLFVNNIHYTLKFTTSTKSSASPATKNECNCRQESNLQPPPRIQPGFDEIL
ncbi:hypothetical protein Pint_36237 [Pistacia integerrima]|uniref:Uncharacterized protein n=1 Tax=Pistacia integerrima TaxID=434235 RepID=A0ACC0XYU8_9ROSI|nr:hypothetical protein Pint_36237 [Pistacia integerrima]